MTNKNTIDQLPLLPVRDIVVYPGMVLPLAVGREKSIQALEHANAKERMIFVTTQKKAQVVDPLQSDLYEIGTVCQVLQSAKMPDDTMKILVEGISRARLSKVVSESKDSFIFVQVERLQDILAKDSEMVALLRQSLTLFEQYSKLNRRVPVEVLVSLQSIEDPSHFSDTLASHLSLKTPEKQQLLEILDVKKRLSKIVEFLSSEIEILNLEKRIQTRVRGQIEKSQKEYYLNEQMKAIQKELRQKDDFTKEVQELSDKIKDAKMPQEAKDAAEKECARLEKMMPYSPEATVVRTYLDWMISLPWNAHTKDTLDVSKAEEVLNAEHYGLDKPKERILEYLSVLKLVNKIKGPILCFSGPPGVGKTSLARSVANALGRNFMRISLGGVHDESEIRGHRRTYIGSLPGRIIQAMRKTKSKNPVLLLDEIDKLGSDWRGDPSAALLEVLDHEQNHNFVDHYLDVGFDLSEVLFIATANVLHNIPRTLQDRLEIIRFSGYTEAEKLFIAKKFLVPKEIKENGLENFDFKISDDALASTIDGFTRESGVRDLQRHVAKLCRKAAKQFVSQKEKKKKIEVTAKNLHDYLGPPDFLREDRAQNSIGMATGLAWTEHGGEILSIEVSAVAGKGKITLTGKLGSVMQESAQAAISYVRSAAPKLGIKNDVFAKNDFHIHVPEGAVPKDGPSAGTALATSIASVCSGVKVKKDVAMTGEITLRGQVLAIGGLKEKVLAAHREGITTVLFPKSNEKDLVDIPKDILKTIKMVPVRHMDEVFRLALESKEKKK